jgi:hypothetical protein
MTSVTSNLFAIVIVLVLVLAPKQIIGISITNDVTVIVEKVTSFVSFQTVTCQLSGLKQISKNALSFDNTTSQLSEYEYTNYNYNITEKETIYKKKRNNIRIVPASQLNGNSIDNLVDASDQYNAYLGNISADNDKTEVKLRLKYETIIGPKVDRLYYDQYGNTYDSGFTNITEMSSTKLSDQFCCIVINNDKTQVLGASQPFRFGPPIPVTINVNTSSVFPGQYIYITISRTNESSMLLREGADFLRVYKVPFDISNNPLALNNATFVATPYLYYSQTLQETNYSLIYYHKVNWKIPGIYQIVILSEYNQIVIGASNVFEVLAITRTKTTTVTVHNSTNGIYPGQEVSATIYKPDNPPIGSRITSAFIPAKDRVIEYVNGTKEWISLSYYWETRTWNSTTTNLTVSATFNSWKSGWYKLVILAGDIVIGVSKQFRVKRPYIRIPLPKRNYSRWGSLPITNNIKMPYSAYGYDMYTMFLILPTYMTDSSFNYFNVLKGPLPYVHEVNGYKINTRQTLTFPPGLYNIRLAVHKVWSYNRYQYFRLDYIVPIANTTFLVVENTAQLMIANNQTNFKYGDIITYSFTTANKVPIYDSFDVYSSEKDWKISDLVQSNTTTDLSVLNGSVQINKSNFGCPFGRYPYNMIQLFIKTDGERVYSPMLSIDEKSKPNDC